MRKSPMKVLAVSLVAVSFLAACGSDSDGSSEEVTVDSSAAVTEDTTATEVTADETDTSKGEIPTGGVEVTLSGDVAGWAGKSVGIANLAPVPGAERWSKPLQACIEANGGKVDYQDVGGDATKLPALLEGWAVAKVDAVFNIGIDMTGQDSLITKFNDAKTPVVIWGAGNPAGVVALDANQEEDGRIIGRYLIEKLGGEGDVVLVNAQNPALQSREKGLQEVLATSNIKLTIVGEAAGFSAEAAQKSVETALQANPAVKAVVGGFGSLGVGAATAVTAAKSEAIVVSMNGDPEEYAAIREGGAFAATVADGHEFGGEAACQIAAGMIAGGAAPGTAGKSILATSVLVTADNVPAEGSAEGTARKFYQLP